jgi:hypothetical protein
MGTTGVSRAASQALEENVKHALRLVASNAIQGLDDLSAAKFMQR